MNLRFFVNNPFRENCFILSDEDRNAVVVDAGMLTEEEQRRVDDYIERHELRVCRLLNTHLHLDHQFGNRHMLETYGVEPWAMEADAFLPGEVARSAALFGIPGVENGLEVTHFLQPYETITVGRMRFRVLPTPGHTPGGCCFFDEQDKLVLTGDTLFQMGVGRTDIDPRYGSMAELQDSIRQELLILPDEVVVLPGHGSRTSIGDEKCYNPYLF